MKCNDALLLVALAGLSAALLTGCSPEEPGGKAAFVAKVNGELISVPHFQLVRARAEAQQPGRSIEAAQLVEGLVQQTLFAQKAAKLQLDRKGLVPAALEDARAAVLARAYIERLVPAADPEVVDRFYDEHPQLFKERRVFRVFELAVAVPAKRIAALKARARRAEGLQPIAEWLKAQNLAFNVGGVTKSSEQLAPPLLEALRHMQEGEVSVLETAGGASVLQLVQSQPAPLSREAARPMIESLLRARSLREIVERESKFLRGKAAIEYGVQLGGAAEGE